jgi:RNA-directed DNA polymerase
VRDFEYHLEPRLCEIRRELVSGAYRWGPYRQFLIQDPKRRTIRAAPFRDRVVHHAIFNVLDPIIRRGFIRDTYACIPGRGCRLQCDIKSYFASVDHGVLLDLLAGRVGDARMLELLRSLIRHGAEQPGTGMPIGNLTSQLFANLYLDPLDHFAKETLRVHQ